MKVSEYVSSIPIFLFLYKIGIEGDAVLPNADDICASFQFTVMIHLAMRLQRAMEFIALKELLPEENLVLVSFISHLSLGKYRHFIYQNPWLCFLYYFRLYPVELHAIRIFEMLSTLYVKNKVTVCMYLLRNTARIMGL